ncbi:DUF1684 domain-containing protein [Oerskovia flava]|uniref:DUF1684 domain-containing protein n=1 Tax=Oerskovia flava TaxID=2986422 RepID=UPI0022400BAF|nr:DUF1684 domain-containing protein [Oerskovia sp. JB1-3-2]
MTSIVTTSPAQSAVAEHAQWRARREAGLREPHGWRSLVDYLWLPSTPSPLPGLPGEWWTDRSALDRPSARLRGSASEPFTVAGSDDVLVGVHTVVVEEGGSTVVGHFLPEGREDAGTVPSRVAVELVRRTGRYALRLRDPHAAARHDAAGVPTFPYDPSWVLDAPVRWFEEPRTIVVGAARPGLVHEVQAVGEVQVERDGIVATVVLTGSARGPVGLLFTDEAGEVAPWRVVWVEEPAVPGTVGTLRLDLNRAVNLPFAFSDFGTCPAPVPGNHVPFAVTAGEKAP